LKALAPGSAAVGQKVGYTVQNKIGVSALIHLNRAVERSIIHFCHGVQVESCRGPAHTSGTTKYFRLWDHFLLDYTRFFQFQILSIVSPSVRVHPTSSHILDNLMILNSKLVCGNPRHHDVSLLEFR
jgi:hypothetical protein